MRQRYRLGLSQVKQFAADLAPLLSGGETLALIGDLGSGKTTFTQALAKALGVRHKVLSPTFIVLQEFSTRKKTLNGQTLNLVHLDLYRTKTFKDVSTLGLPQIWGQNHNITVIEWADKIKARLPKNTIYIYLKRDVK